MMVTMPNAQSKAAIVKKEQPDGKAGIVAAIKRNRSNIMLVLLAAILVWTLVYQVTHVEGPSYFGDDSTYTYFANQILHGTFVENVDVFSLRILTLYPMAFFYLIFGVGKLSSAAWAIASLLGSVVVAFYLGKELYNDYVGILSALFMSTYPLLMIISGTPSPDVPGAFFVCLAILALVRGQRLNSRGWFFTSGAMVVASFLATPSTVYAFVVILAYIIVELARKKLKVSKVSLYLVYGILIAGILLMAYNYLTTGNALVTIKTTEAVYSTAGTSVEGVLVNTNLMYYFNEIFSYNVIAIIGRAAASHNFNIISIWDQIYVPNYGEEGFFFYAAVAFAIYLVVVREKRAYLPIMWLLLGFLALEFGPIYISLHPFRYLLTNRLARYLTIIIMPTVMITAMAIVNMCERAHKAKMDYLIIIPILFAVFLVATSIPIILYWHTIIYYIMYDQTAVANYLNKLPSSTPVYTESGYMVEIMMHYNNMSRFQVWDGITNCKSIPAGSYVIVPKDIRAFNLSWTPLPNLKCPNWKLVLYPQIPGNYSPFIKAPAGPFYTTLYYVQGGS